MFSKAIFRFLSSQYRFPTGILGRYVGKKMDELNNDQSDWVLSLLRLKTDDRVLEVGFGTGRVIKKITYIVKNGQILGLDPSGTMNKVASKRLKGEIRSGQVQLVKGFAEKSTLLSDTFTKIFAIHVVYFWKDLEKVFTEFFRISAPNVLVAIYYVSPVLSPNKLFYEYSENEIKSAMVSAGFQKIQIAHKQFGKQNGICVLAEK